MERATSPRWTQLSEFPEAPSDWTSYYPLIFATVAGEDRARHHIKTSNLTFPILLSSPASDGRYLPPILVDTETVSGKLARDASIFRTMTIAMVLLGTFAFFLAADLRGAAYFLFVSTTIAIYASFNHRVSRSPDALMERAKFYGWCFSNSPIYAYSFLTTMIILGSLQLYGNDFYGSSEAFKLEFGAIYSNVVDRGEWWRLLSAPLVHNSVAHWLINTLIGSALLLVYGPVLRSRIVWLMAVLAPLSFLAVSVASRFIDLDSEGIVGISGGIAGVVGYFFAANLRCPSCFPRHFSITTAFVVLSTLLVVSLVTSTTSFIAHFAGFIGGVLLGSITNPIPKSFYR